MCNSQEILSSCTFTCNLTVAYYSWSHHCHQYIPDFHHNGLWNGYIDCCCTEM